MTQASVVVSCYKQEKYIQECLNSILSQVTDFDFEILVSDDASPDSTPLLLKGLKEKHPEKIELILREKNVGAARNYIDLHNRARGDLVFHMDGDDVMLPGKLQKQFDVFKNNPAVNVVFHRSCYFSDDGSYNAPTGALPFNQKVFIGDIHTLARWGTIAAHSTYAYRRASRKTRDLDREFMEWFFAMDSLLPKAQFAYIDEILLKYRSSPNSGAYLSTRSGRLKAYRIYFRDIEFYFGRDRYLRGDLMANFVFSFVAMLVNGRIFLKEPLFFIIRHFWYIRPAKILETFRVRKSVRPESSAMQISTKK